MGEKDCVKTRLGKTMTWSSMWQKTVRSEYVTLEHVTYVLNALDQLPHLFKLKLCTDLDDNGEADQKTHMNDTYTSNHHLLSYTTLVSLW